MDFEKYTDRAKGFLQSAQGLALREGHQRFLPEHLLKVLLDDPEGMAANLIQTAGGNAKAAQQAVEAAAQEAAQGRGRRRRPGLHGAGDRAPVRPGASRSRRRPATASSPSSSCCWRWR